MEIAALREQLQVMSDTQLSDRDTALLQETINQLEKMIQDGQRNETSLRNELASLENKHEDLLQRYSTLKYDVEQLKTSIDTQGLSLSRDKPQVIELSRDENDHVHRESPDSQQIDSKRDTSSQADPSLQRGELDSNNSIDERHTSLATEPLESHVSSKDNEKLFHLTSTFDSDDNSRLTPPPVSEPQISPIIPPSSPSPEHREILVDKATSPRSQSDSDDSSSSSDDLSDRNSHLSMEIADKPKSKHTKEMLERLDAKYVELKNRDYRPLQSSPLSISSFYTSTIVTPKHPSSPPSIQKSDTKLSSDTPSHSQSPEKIRPIQTPKSAFPWKKSTPPQASASVRPVTAQPSTKTRQARKPMWGTKSASQADSPIGTPNKSQQSPARRAVGLQRGQSANSSSSNHSPAEYQQTSIQNTSSPSQTTRQVGLIRGRGTIAPEPSQTEVDVSPQQTIGRTRGLVSSQPKTLSQSSPSPSRRSQPLATPKQAQQTGLRKNASPTRSFSPRRSTQSRSSSSPNRSLPKFPSRPSQSPLRFSKNSQQSPTKSSPTRTSFLTQTARTSAKSPQRSNKVTPEPPEMRKLKERLLEIALIQENAVIVEELRRMEQELRIEYQNKVSRMKEEKAKMKETQRKLRNELKSKDEELSLLNTTIDSLKTENSAQKRKILRLSNFENAMAELELLRKINGELTKEVDEMRREKEKHEEEQRKREKEERKRALLEEELKEQERLRLEIQNRSHISESLSESQKKIETTMQTLLEQESLERSERKAREEERQRNLQLSYTSVDWNESESPDALRNTRVSTASRTMRKLKRMETDEESDSFDDTYFDPKRVGGTLFRKQVYPYD
ncbi:hypothetical protein BLNAU_15561 [Blattamonas nauphoetae]|uniref:Uncharacterized protein n=1 Tax=Blattamonas nauphoetae TaxID=2049346 RepID=A0ABQ9XDW0_9EUKA|nr:hypothetical protein BLNAU_15561 [Blattamonas nauphoetae]